MDPSYIDRIRSAQDMAVCLVKGQFYDRIRYGEEKHWSLCVEDADSFAIAHGVCPGCSVLKGQFHVGLDCRFEQCACCGCRLDICQCERELEDETMPREAILTAEVVSPGFSIDLSTWLLIIDEKGTMRQDVHAAGQHRTLEGRMPGDEIAAIIKEIERMKFLGFRPHYRAPVFDCATLAISVRISGFAKRVEAYAPDFIASGQHWRGSQQDRQDMQGFVELWDSIHRHAPYGKA